MKRRLALWVAALLMPWVASAQNADMPQPADLSIGDSWTWQQSDDRTKLKEPTRSLTVVDLAGEKRLTNGSQTYRLSDLFVDGGYPLPGASQKPVDQPWRQWPLQVGKKWIFDMDWVRADGATGNTRQDVEVVAFEEVEVPAGKFMAFRIVHKGFYRNSNGGRGRQEDTYWYAPDARADVKVRRDDRVNVVTRELVSYRRGGRSSDAAPPAAAVTTAPAPSASAGGGASRSYFDKNQLAAAFTGKAVRMKRYADGVVMHFKFNSDATAAREREGTSNRSSSGTWEITDRLCAHFGPDHPCFLFYEEGGVVKAGPRNEEARWEVIDIK